MKGGTAKRGERHIPTVVLATIRPNDEGTPGRLTHVTVDGVEWPVQMYEIVGSFNEYQTITLTFFADVTITHETPAVVYQQVDGSLVPDRGPFVHPEDET